MTKNMGTADRAIRIVVGLILLYLAFGTAALSGVLNALAIIFGLVFIVTSAIGFCPLYRPLGMNTCSKD